MPRGGAFSAVVVSAMLGEPHPFRCKEDIVADDRPRYRPLNDRDSPDDEELARRRTAAPEVVIEPPGGPVTLDWESALVVARAVLFYTRNWQASNPESDGPSPTRALLEDGGMMAANAERCLPFNLLGAVNEELEANEPR
jgi:hypothetical protein